MTRQIRIMFFSDFHGIAVKVRCYEVPSDGEISHKVTDIERQLNIKGHTHGNISCK